MLKVALRFYNVKKNIKKLLKNKRDSVEFLPSDKLSRVLEVEMDKNKIEQELLESTDVLYSNRFTYCLVSTK